MDDTKIIEKGKQSLSFVEQLQNQIQLCREAISDITIPLTSRVEALEGLLWAKLKDDKEYLDTIKQLNEYFQKKNETFKNNNQGYAWQIEKTINRYNRARAKEQFKAIMIFIDKKGYMPLGEENE